MCGFSGLWDLHSFPNVKWLTGAVKQKLTDNFITKWSPDDDTSSSNLNYRLFKTKFCLEKYLVTLPPKFRKPLLQMRTRNHHLPIETGRWNQIARDERLCHICNAEISDEYYYIMICKNLADLRVSYISRYFHMHPNTLKFEQLMNTTNQKALKKITTFIKIIFSILRRN